MDKATLSARFQALVAETFEPLSKAYGLRMSKTDSFSVRFDGHEVFVTVAYDALRSLELIAGIGLQAGVVRAVERPFQLSELLRAVGQYSLPEAQMHEIVARHDDLRSALEHLADVLTKYGQEALRGDRSLFSRLDSQRDLDCLRYQHDRDLGNASRAAFVAWSRGEYRTVVALLKPFEERLTADERQVLDAAEGRQ